MNETVLQFPFPLFSLLETCWGYFTTSNSTIDADLTPFSRKTITGQLRNRFTYKAIILSSTDQSSFQITRNALH